MHLDWRLNSQYRGRGGRAKWWWSAVSFTKNQSWDAGIHPCSHFKLSMVGRGFKRFYSPAPRFLQILCGCCLTLYWDRKPHHCVQYLVPRYAWPQAQLSTGCILMDLKEIFIQVLYSHKSHAALQGSLWTAAPLSSRDHSQLPRHSSGASAAPHGTASPDPSANPPLP